MSSKLKESALSDFALRDFPDYDKKCAVAQKLYGENAFTITTMKKYLPKNVFKKLKSTIKTGARLDHEIADEVAIAMKSWAIEHGATHYTHWFQPLTGSTAEKHDSFVEPDGEGNIDMEFSGKALIQGESDASSFPSGGIRATFEARGYTAWDPTSPAFIKKSPKGATLCIPTAFCSYTGDALDKKTPLLRSMKVISEQAKKLLACFDEDSEGMAWTTLGCEQEYFLVDKALYYSRPDLIQTGRTLYGNVPPKHQQMDDHYFGAIKSRVMAFMEDVDLELWKLGIPAKTRHNEVSPAQFELACVFESLNLATDHNMMVMETLLLVAEKHNLVCLLHEKPYAGVNGSGKHNNWSISSPDGRKLIDPGDNPHDNAIFLTFLCAIIKAVDKYAPLLRGAVATAGNDHRLGANEAPPAILSIFLGEQLYDVIEQIEAGGAKSSKDKVSLNIGVDSLPELPKDVSDRNRTSPLAFTGNKFEFRAVGSQQSCAGSNIVLNTIVAEVLDEIATELENYSGDDFNGKLQSILQKIIKEHKKILFNGDGYSEEWKKEAEERGLPNIEKTPEALMEMKSETAVKLFEKYSILSKKELESRYEVYIEQYDTINKIESKVSLNIAKTKIFPAIVKYQNELIKNLKGLTESGLESGQNSLKNSIEKIGSLSDDMNEKCMILEKAVDSGNSKEMIECMNSLRETVDKLELVVDSSKWPLPNYSELLFYI